MITPGFRRLSEQLKAHAGFGRSARSNSAGVSSMHSDRGTMVKNRPPACGWARDPFLAPDEDDQSWKGGPRAPGMAAGSLRPCEHRDVCCCLLWTSLMGHRRQGCLSSSECGPSLAMVPRPASDGCRSSTAGPAHRQRKPAPQLWVWKRRPATASGNRLAADRSRPMPAVGRPVTTGSGKPAPEGNSSGLRPRPRIHAGRIHHRQCRARRPVARPKPAGR